MAKSTASQDYSNQLYATNIENKPQLNIEDENQ